MQTGTVAHFSTMKGFGFICCDDGGDDVFVHHTGIDQEGYRKLEKGQRVEFDVEMGPKGKPQATGVRVIGQPEEGRVRGVSSRSN